MSNHHDADVLDLLGIGIGPFNLSLAALLSPVKTITSHFMEQKNSFSWHPGMLLPDAEIQVSHLKDLVTLVDPTNPYSFIAYLVKHKRLYRFINARFKQVLRAEFNHYLQWVCQSLSNLSFAEKVEDVEFKQSNFLLHTSKRTIKSKHLALGSGLVPYIPAYGKKHLSRTVYHCKDFLFRDEHWHGKRLVVIGGGQSGAEIILHILSKRDKLPKELVWISKRDQFLPIDDSVFVNELFTPNYSAYFYELSESRRMDLLQEQTLASDGISQSLLEMIYQKLYVLELIENRGRFFHLMPNHQMVHMDLDHDVKKIIVNELKTDRKKSLSADIVIFCTGYRFEIPAYLASIRERIHWHKGQFYVNPDYSIAWDGPKQNRIYVQNAARHTHGIADPNLSLMAWRSAKIINSLSETQVYDIEDESLALEWPTTLSNKEIFQHVSNA